MKEEVYGEIKETLRDLDLVLFRGREFVSNAIAWFQSLDIQRPNVAEFAIDERAFTHCGFVITRELVNDERLEPGKLYIMESTMSGPLNDNVLNINGESFLGVQIRNLDDVVREYNALPGTRVAFGRLDRPTLRKLQKMPQGELSVRLTNLVHRFEGTRYDANPISLLSTIFNIFRFCRKDVEDFTGTEDWLFCSEFVALIYKMIGIFPDNC